MVTVLDHHPGHSDEEETTNVGVISLNEASANGHVDALF